MHYYNLEVVRGRVIICACQVDIHIYCKSVHVSHSHLSFVKMVVPAPYIPSPVSPTAQAEVLPSIMYSLLGCFHDILSCG